MNLASQTFFTSIKTLFLIVVEENSLFPSLLLYDPAALWLVVIVIKVEQYEVRRRLGASTNTETLLKNNSFFNYFGRIVRTGEIYEAFSCGLAKIVESCAFWVIMCTSLLVIPAQNSDFDGRPSRAPTEITIFALKSPEVPNFWWFQCKNSDFSGIRKALFLS